MVKLPKSMADLIKSELTEVNRAIRRLTRQKDRLEKELKGKKKSPLKKVRVLR